ncbi:hypothetical protein [Blastococcus brunescens]|uniref:Uncharacterized protein n=1 Tax=Blastococcus brunescens TaxID=1564165 RepID=A0ABZ1AXG6_9ACTN|nr:hypothetical protein [Blastococcus sp. BMG 8361]WRL63264.1 hypothetical protein U6N30_26425 [Blastococcus sp. BMG 8361]
MSSGRERVDQYLHDTARPALAEAAAELRVRGLEAEARWVGDGPGRSYVELTAHADGEVPFRYRIQSREIPRRGTGARSSADADHSRLDVHLGSAGRGDGDVSYDVMNYTHAQLIDDALDKYERHVEVRSRLG